MGTDQTVFSVEEITEKFNGLRNNLILNHITLTKPEFELRFSDTSKTSREHLHFNTFEKIYNIIRDIDGASEIYETINVMRNIPDTQSIYIQEYAYQNGIFAKKMRRLKDRQYRSDTFDSPFGKYFAALSTETTLNDADAKKYDEISVSAAVTRIKLRYGKTDKNGAFRYDLTAAITINSVIGNAVLQQRSVLFPRDVAITEETFVKYAKFAETFEFEIEFVADRDFRRDDLVEIRELFTNVDANYEKRSAVRGELLAIITRLFPNIDAKSHNLSYITNVNAITNQVRELTRSDLYDKVLPNIGNYYVTDKADGVRAVGVLSSGRLSVITSDVAHYNVKTITTPMTIVDGELITIGKNTRKLYVFDVLMHRSISLIDVPFSSRMIDVEKICAMAPDLLAPKRFKRLTRDTASAIIKETYERKDHDYAIDGLIFTPEDIVQIAVSAGGDTLVAPISHGSISQMSGVISVGCYADSSMPVFGSGAIVASKHDDAEDNAEIYVETDTKTAETVSITETQLETDAASDLANIGELESVELGLPVLDMKIGGKIGTNSAESGFSMRGKYFRSIHYKWKKSDEMTIDFLIRKIPQTWIGRGVFVPKSDETLYALFTSMSRTNRDRSGIAPLPFYSDIFPQSATYRDVVPTQFAPVDCANAFLYYSTNGALDGKIAEFAVTSAQARDACPPDWTLKRIREDKSLLYSIGNYFGNSFKVANSLWMSLLTPITYAELLELKSPTQYFQTRTETAEFRASNRYVLFVKRRVISGLRGARRILDLASGRGAEIHSYLLGSGADEIVFVERDAFAIQELADRYRSVVSETREKLPRVRVVHHDLLDKSENVIDHIHQVAGNDYFDAVVCNLAIHYFAQTEHTMSNFLRIVRAVLAPDGVFVYTAFNNARIYDIFTTPPQIGTVVVENSRSNQALWQYQHQFGQVLYAIRREFSEESPKGFGKAIDVMLPFSSEFYREYLVDTAAITSMLRMIESKFVTKPIIVPFDRFEAAYITEDKKHLNLSESDKFWVYLFDVVIFRKGSPKFTVIDVKSMNREYEKSEKNEQFEISDNLPTKMSINRGETSAKSGKSGKMRKTRKGAVGGADKLRYGRVTNAEYEMIVSRYGRDVYESSEIILAHSPLPIATDSAKLRDAKRAEITEASRKIAFTRVLTADYPQLHYRELRDELKPNLHWGQRKLLMAELEYLTLYGDESDVVVYAGAAPCVHLPYLLELFPRHKFVLWDPNAFARKLTNYPSRVEIHTNTPNGFFTDEVARLYRGKRVHFWSDIRTGGLERDPYGEMIDDSTSEFDEQIVMNMEMQKKWHEIIEPVRSMLKFRLMWNDGETVYLDGEIRLQVWAPRTSTETRLIVPHGNKTRSYNNRKYEGQMFRFNRCTRTQWHDEVATGNGMDHCYDCAAETYIISNYLKKFRPKAATLQDVAIEVDKISQILASDGAKTLYQPPHGFMPNTPYDEKITELIVISPISTPQITIH
ncbi:MAG TPA: hypothetical protein VI821_00355 [Candidatus Paceibacterota bacterium]